MAWYLRWQCKFASLNETQYSVNIYEKMYSGSTTQLEAADNPFATYENSEEDIFTPVRGQTGYLRVLDTDGTLMEQIVPKNNTEKKVTLTDGSGNVKWQGFLCAAAYTQPWDSQTNIVEFTLNSVLSVLENVQIRESLFGGEFFAARLFVEAIQDLEVDIDSIFVSTDMLSDMQYLFGVYLQFSVFFSAETIYNMDEPQEYLNCMSYYDCITSVMLLYGLTIREEGNCLYISHYDKTDDGRIATNRYSWAYLKLMSIGEFGFLGDFSNMPDKDLLPSLDFAETENVSGFMLGARSVRIIVNIGKPSQTIAFLPQATEDITKVEEIKYVTNIRVFVQPQPPRYDTNETFTYSYYKSGGSLEEINLLRYIGSSSYEECLENSVVRNEYYQRINGEFTVITGAFPCRWIAQNFEPEEGLLLNGIFFNAFHPVEAHESLPTIKECYCLSSGVDITSADGYLCLNMQIHHFYYDTYETKFDSGNLYTQINCILTYGDKEWDGSSWVNYDGDYKTFTIAFFNGNIFRDTKPEDTDAQGLSGYFIPISKDLGGVITFRITNRFSNRSGQAFYESHAFIITGLNISLIRKSNDEASQRTQNTYRKVIMTNGFRDDKEVSMILGTMNNNVDAATFIKTSKNSYLHEIGYDLDRDIYTRPELRLLNRMANYYSMARRTFMGVVQIGVELMKTRYSYIGKKFFGVKDETNWADDTQTVKFIEVT